MKRNAQAALLALTAFAVLPAKSTPSTSHTLAHAPIGIGGDASAKKRKAVPTSGIDGEDIADLGNTDDLPGLITASFSPDAIRGGLQPQSAPGLELDLHEEGRSDPTLRDDARSQDAALPAGDGVTPATPPVQNAAPAETEPTAGVDARETLPEIRTERENAPKPRLTYIGLIKPEHIVREQRCLAEAVYFEARSEPEDGRAAVAQVVLNRVKSGVYPGTVCGVVYQNRHRRLACQFTFACEGKALRITETRSWEVAVRIARDVYEGRIYLAEVGVATHYHADYVQPSWAKKLKKMDVIGRHIFYS
ncbi:cell wall hydrolase [Bosea sp. (in: a-proteobacteria)]|jgi:spore germination cell wall hydrolase CwlJ-like protein|uniref:cell wall hydrolase n=1 Tax=Bosea sp. (in: a-proteobacteria) TaxID=1871050 RepID=UPI0039C892E4